MWRTRSFRGTARIGIGTAIAAAGAAVAACSSNGVPALPTFDRTQPPPLLFAVDIASGGVRFAIPQTSTTQRLANLVVSDGVIVAEAYNCARSGATSIQAFDAADGSLKWTYTSPAGPELSFDNLTAVDGVVVFSLDEYQVASTAIALDLDSGKTRWTRTFTGTASVHASGVEPGTVIGVDQQAIVGLDRTSGKQLWTVDDPTDTPYFTVLDPSGLMTTAGGSRLIDMANGREPWPSTKGTAILLDRRVAASTSVLVGETSSSNSTVTAVDARSGERLWQTHGETGWFPQRWGVQFVAGNTLMLDYEASAQSIVDMPTGEIRWVLQTTGPGHPDLIGDLVIAPEGDITDPRLVVMRASDGHEIGTIPWIDTMETPIAIDDKALVGAWDCSAYSGDEIGYWLEDYQSRLVYHGPLDGLPIGTGATAAPDTAPGVTDQVTPTTTTVEATATATASTISSAWMPEDNALLAFDGRTNEVLFTVPVTPETQAVERLTTWQDLAIGITTDCGEPKTVRLTAFDHRSGVIRWQSDPFRPAQVWGPRLSATDGIVVVPTMIDEDVRLVAYDASNGARLWERPKSGITWFDDVAGSVIAQSSPDGYVGIDRRNGETRWQRPLRGSLVMLRNAGVTLIVDQQQNRVAGTVLAIDNTDGSELWRLVDVNKSAPILDSMSTVVIQTIDGIVHGLAARTGKETWRRDDLALDAFVWNRNFPDLQMNTTGFRSIPSNTPDTTDVRVELDTGMTFDPWVIGRVDQAGTVGMVSNAGVEDQPGPWVGWGYRVDDAVTGSRLSEFPWVSPNTVQPDSRIAPPVFSDLGVVYRTHLCATY